jgi:DNA polymerase delta subunit 2
MLLSFLSGSLGQANKAAAISHCIIAGGLVSPDGSGVGSGGGGTEAVVTGVKDLDATCWQLASAAVGMPVTLVPGAQDPTTAAWPQRPLHRSLLAASSQQENLYRSPNPYAAIHGNKYVMGTDGANVADLVQQLNEKESAEDDSVSELEALRRTLEWSHLCPTGPASVPTAPVEQDPCVITEQPDVYFCGGTSKFATTTVKTGDDSNHTCRLLCIPSFAETATAVLVHLETLHVELMRFQDE